MESLCHCDAKLYMHAELCDLGVVAVIALSSAMVVI